MLEARDDGASTQSVVATRWLVPVKSSSLPIQVYFAIGYQANQNWKEAPHLAHTSSYFNLASSHFGVLDLGLSSGRPPTTCFSCFQVLKWGSNEIQNLLASDINSADKSATKRGQQNYLLSRRGRWNKLPLLGTQMAAGESECGKETVSQLISFCLCRACWEWFALWKVKLFTQTYSGKGNPLFLFLCFSVSLTVTLSLQPKTLCRIKIAI